MLAMSHAAAAATDPEDELPDYGSGLLGAWQGNTPRVSSDSILEQVANDPDGVLAVGDSILHQCATPVAEMVNAHGANFGVSAWPGRPTGPAVDWLVDVAARGLLAPRLLVATGSNDVFDPVSFVPQIDRLMTLAAGRPVCWVTPYVDRWAYPGTRVEDAHNTAAVYGALCRALKHWPNLWLADWHWLLRSKPGSTHPPGYPGVMTLPRPAAYLRDGVHPSTLGVPAWVATIENALY
jgi:hypothetical protein